MDEWEFDWPEASGIDPQDIYIQFDFNIPGEGRYEIISDDELIPTVRFSMDD